MKFRLRQKLALGCSLCLVVATISSTIIKLLGFLISGYEPPIDKVWISYWQLIAATAFRSLYITERHEVSPDHHQYPSLFNRGYRYLRYTFSFRFWRSNYSFHGDESSVHGPVETLPHTDERATMTGMRTFTNQRANVEPSTLNSIVNYENGGPWLLDPMEKTLLQNSAVFRVISRHSHGAPRPSSLP